MNGTYIYTYIYTKYIYRAKKMFYMYLVNLGKETRTNFYFDKIVDRIKGRYGRFQRSTWWAGNQTIGRYFRWRRWQRWPRPAVRTIHHHLRTVATVATIVNNANSLFVCTNWSFDDLTIHRIVSYLRFHSGFLSIFPFFIIIICCCSFFGYLINHFQMHRHTHKSSTPLSLSLVLWKNTSNLG